MARPSKLTPATEKVILDALRAGATRTAAFEAAGIDRSQCARWLARFASFRAAVTQAEAQAELFATVKVRQAADIDWKAALAWLERRRHAEWSPRSRLELEIKLTAERIAAETGADPEWLVQRAREIAEKAGSGAL